MNIKRIKLLCLILVFGAIFASCSVTKLIPEGDYLVSKNRVHIAYSDTLSRELEVKARDAMRYIPLAQTPNARIFGIDLRTWLYMKSDSSNNNWGNRTLRKMGLSPVYFDEELTRKSVENMRIFMASKGFLDNTIVSRISYKEKKAYIDYDITANSIYRIDSVQYVINDDNVRDYVLADSSSVLLKSGDVFSRELLELERKRIARLLNDKGFFTFAVNNIDYLIDTTSVGHLASVQVNINKHRVGNDYVNHKIYKIKDIFVYPNYNGKIADSSHIDTIKLKGINFLYQDSVINIKANPLSRLIRYAPGNIWSPSEVENSNRSLLNMQYYRASSFDFKLTEDSGIKDTLKYGALDSYIRLTPSKISGIKLEGEVSSNQNYTTIMARLGYSNKNLFKHSELFEINFNIGYDLFYNQGLPDAYQIGVETSLSFPKLVVPYRVKNTKFIHNIESKVTIGYDIQNRPDYQRNIVTTMFGYRWSSGKYFRFTYNPAALSFISLPRISQGYLDNITNIYLRNSYTDQFIVGSNFGMLYNKERSIGSNYMLKVNAEIGGNLLYLGGLAAGQKKHTNSDGESFYEIFNIRYAQYARIDVDFSYKYNITDKLAVVSRVYAGLGTGYGNSSKMPFERLFYSGGNSSMRGWSIRSLGPGSKYLTDEDKTYPNSLGDIRLEMNLEGRFPLFGPLRGALFFDVGNVWTNGKGERDESAIFYFDQFYKQLGFNTGVGLRLDLGFFVVRLDWGIILHNPNKLVSERWITSFNLSDTTLHFAIGYPF